MWKTENGSDSVLETELLKNFASVQAVFQQKLRAIP